ncbi:MAG: histidine phosphatase family protein [Pirellulaceae bacterium]|nr:histidine phosphatase family protein [Pirellulaceae bacterium]
MKTLLLLRHAKSSWKDSDQDDHDRPLNKRGKRDAPRMGELLRDEGLLPDLIVVSSARRARKTAEHVIQASGYRGETRITGELYEADAAKLMQVLAGLTATCGRVLLVGHNPGLEELLEALTGAYAPLSTAALAKIDLPIEAWGEISSSQGQLGHIWQPGELE